MSKMGSDSHSRSRRLPMGDAQRSRTSTRLVPSVPALLWKISRLRKVKRSIQTKLPSSMRPMLQMFLRPV